VLARDQPLALVFTELDREAGRRGAEWIVPFDADELGRSPKKSPQFAGRHRRRLRAADQLCPGSFSAGCSA
jgi:hypothetical protein